MDLKGELKEIWKKAIIPGYEEGSFCSERHLQAIFFGALKQKFTTADGYAVWVEPRLSGDEDFTGVLKNKVPDLLITKGQVVIVYIELKYVPFGYVIYESDLIKLSEEKTFGNVYLKTDIKSGNWNKKDSYSFENCLKVFGAIGKKGSAAFDIPEKEFFLPLIHEVEGLTFNIKN